MTRTATCRILERIAAKGPDGMTAPELHKELGIPRSTATSRVSTLHRRGAIEPRGRRAAYGERASSLIYVARDPAQPRTPVSIPPTSTKIKNHFVLVLDGSRSMEPHRSGAAKFFNRQLDTVKAAGDQENTVTVFHFGLKGERQGSIKEKMFNVPTALVPQTSEQEYPAIGNTPLYDGVLEASRRAMCDGDPEKSFVVICITDGEENQSRHTSADLQQFIKERQATDRWTFVFLVPKGYKRKFVGASGVHDGNVREWDDIRTADIETVTATEDFLKARRTGVRAVKQYFAADLSKITQQDLTQLRDVTNDVNIWTVDKETDVQAFVNEKSNGRFMPGRSFFEVMKKEGRFQDYKRLLVMERNTKRVYADGAVSTRFFCGFPTTGDIAIEPGNHGNFVVLAQSMSTNRILPRGTRVVFWEGAV